MSEDLRERLCAAMAVRNRSRWRKLLRPGLPRYATVALARRGRTPRRVRAPLFFGGEMDLVLPEVVSESIYLFGFFDDVTTWLALEAVRPGHTVLDVGAHFGYFSLLASHLAGDRGRVFAFEPTPATFDILSANARRRPNITPIRAGAGDETCEREMTVYDLRWLAFNTLSGADRLPEGVAAAGRQVKVPLLRLDDFVREHGLAPDVIKIDAENFEDHVIGGLTETLTKYRPRLILEAGEQPAADAAKRLLELGYAPFVCNPPHAVERWNGPIEEANARRRDLLFQPEV